RLQGSRRCMKSTTGERTATLKIETKISSRTWPTDASAHASATATPTRRIVRIDMKTASSRRSVRSASAGGSGPLTLIGPSDTSRIGWGCSAVRRDVDEHLRDLRQLVAQARVDVVHRRRELVHAQAGVWVHLRGDHCLLGSDVDRVQLADLAHRR